MTTLCASCGFDNPPGMKFCGNCGARLSASAAPEPSAAPANPFGAEFGALIGADLAERLRRAGVEATGQRRNVTVLFADITGFTALSQRVDSEDLYEMIQKYIRVLSANVYKYDGVIDKITGDGIMALYGAPISHENNAERAVRSALDMQEDLQKLRQELKTSMDFDLAVRIGIHSGAVIVGGIGSDLLMNYTAIGDTVNLSHRIEEAAPPGAILVSEATYRQVRAFFECQQVSVFNAKGIAHPVVAYRVAGLKARPGSVRGIEGLRAPMIGRDHELNTLLSAAADLVENGHSQVALITGEAGLGKSRLTAEFKAGVAASGIAVLSAQSLAYRRVSYWLIRELIYNYLDLPSTTPPFQVRDRLSRYVFQRMGLHAEDALAYLEDLMGLPHSDPQSDERLKRMEPDQLRQQTFLAVRDLLLIEAQVHPLLLVLDDLHWADDASLELLTFLLDSLRNAPMFLLLISRQVQSGPLQHIVDWSRHNLGARYNEIPLQSLSQDQSRQLLELLLSIPDLPEKLRDQVVQRAAGIPFYLEEILRMLIDQGVLQAVDGQWQVAPGANMAGLGVPDTLQELILARFDRLPPTHRRILQVAAVIGKDFSLPLLSPVLHSGELPELHGAIDSLVEREFIQPQAAAPETEYTFRHILMSDAIYSTMLRTERSAMHGMVAETIERMYADRLDEQVDLLANHYRWSPYQDRALRYTLLAGQKAARNQANHQAAQYFETCLEMMQRTPASNFQSFQVYMGLGDTQMFFGEYPKARECYEKAMQALNVGTGSLNVQERSALYRRLARTYERIGDYDQALAHLKKAQESLDRAPDMFPVERAQALNDLAWLHFRRGNALEAESLLRKALLLADSTDAYDVVASIYNRLGGVAYQTGDLDKAAGYLRQSITIREEARDLANLATSLTNLGVLELEMGDLNRSLQTMTRGYELKTRLGQPEGMAMGLTNLGWLRIQLGDLDEARRDLEKARDLTAQIGYSFLQCQILRMFGELALMGEDWDTAQQYFHSYLKCIEGQEEEAGETLADAYRLLAEAALGRSDLSAAMVWMEAADKVWVNMAPDVQAGLERGDYLRVKGRLALCQNDHRSAAGYFDESLHVFRTLRSRLNETRIFFQQGLLAEAQGMYDDAERLLALAEQNFLAMGARLDERRAHRARVS